MNMWTLDNYSNRLSGVLSFINVKFTLIKWLYIPIDTVGEWC